MIHDCLIVGGGPAGLTCGIFLARFRRSFVLADEGQSRAAWIPASHNHPAFPHGINGCDLLARMGSQLTRFGGFRRIAHVSSVSRQPDGLFYATLDNQTLISRTVVLASGVIDKEPPLPDAPDWVRRGLIRQCPICDGYEAIDRQIVVIGHGQQGIGEALFMRTYTAKITLVTLGIDPDAVARQRHALMAGGIKVVECKLESIAVGADRLARLCFADGTVLRSDTVYSALGVIPRSEFAAALSLAMEEGRIITDKHQRTSVDGCYAAGDIVTGLNQLAVAMAQGEIAAVDIHNRLRRDR